MSLPFLPVRRRHPVKKNLPTAAAFVFLLCLCLTLISCTSQSTKSERQTETPVAPPPALLFAGDSIMEGLGPVVAGMLPNQGNLKIGGRNHRYYCSKWRNIHLGFAPHNGPQLPAAQSFCDQGSHSEDLRAQKRGIY